MNHIHHWSGFALSWNEIFGTNPVSLATEYSTVMRRPSGSHTEYLPVTFRNKKKILNNYPFYYTAFIAHSIITNLETIHPINLPFLFHHQLHFYRKIAFFLDLSLRTDIHTKKKKLKEEKPTFLQSLYNLWCDTYFSIPHNKTQEPKFTGSNLSSAGACGAA